MHKKENNFKNWSHVLEVAESVFAGIEDSRCLFRGHNSTSWRLLPKLLRQKTGDDISIENEYFADFLACSPRFVPENSNSWEILFYCQHHGGCTRLLDWTSSFSTAVYFAAYPQVQDFSIWIVDFGKLNEQSLGEPFYETFTRFADRNDYIRDFLKKDWRPPYPFAIKPPRFNPRIIAQQGYFTFHTRGPIPLEEQCPDCVVELVISKNLVESARKWLTRISHKD